jgi:hypothetical protein
MQEEPTRQAELQYLGCVCNESIPTALLIRACASTVVLFFCCLKIVAADIFKRYTLAGERGGEGVTWLSLDTKECVNCDV